MEATITIKGQFAPGNPQTFSELFGVSSLGETVVDTNYSKGTPTIGTSDETLPLGDVAVPKRLWVQNLGAFPVRFRAGSSGTYDCECLAGSQIYTNWNGAAVHAIAIGGASQIRFFIGGV